MDEAWKPTIKGTLEWLQSDLHGGLLSVVAPPGSGKTSIIPRAVVGMRQADVRIIYALSSNAEKGAFYDGISQTYLDTAECVDDVFDIKSRATLWVVTRKALSSMLRDNDGFPEKAVVILDHDVSCSAEYVLLWMRLVARVAARPDGGLCKIICLSSKHMPEWQTLASPSSPDRVTAGVEREIGWEHGRMPNFPTPLQARNHGEARADTAYVLEEFRLGRPSLLLFFGTADDAALFLPSLEQPGPLREVVQVDKRKLDLGLPLPLPKHAVVVVPPEAWMTMDMASRLPLRQTRHIVIFGRGERGLVFDDKMRTVVHDTTRVPASPDEIHRVGICMSAGVSTRDLHKINVHVPSWPASDDVVLHAANRHIYALVFGVTELGLAGYPWVYVKRMLRAMMTMRRAGETWRRLAIMGCIEYCPRTPAPSQCPWKLAEGRAQYLGRWISAVENFEAAYLLAGVEHEMKGPTSPAAQQTIVFMALIMAHAAECRDAVTILNPEMACRDAREMSMPVVRARTGMGFLWSCLGIWLSAAMGRTNNWELSSIKVKLDVFQQLQRRHGRIFGELLGRRGISLREFCNRPLSDDDVHQVTVVLFCCNTFRVSGVNNGRIDEELHAFHLAANVACSVQSPWAALLDRNAYGNESAYFVVASSSVRKSGDDLELPDATYVPENIVKQWLHSDLSRPGHPPRAEELEARDLFAYRTS
ncbi:hypothetical protein HYQ45_013043 [Verticillium longisporum]|uniref:Uncharacterized protein n=1 Tax=Verticillium longisporum TaxID=100787 RepID=A0A8I3AJT5_VERLO|nr:hypothetical protein HYQ45_013043 [Verticillium longisporum]